MNLFNPNNIIVSFFFCAIFSVIQTNGQEKFGEQGIRFGSQNCESFRRNLEVYLLENEEIKPETSLIIIFRPEKGERQKYYQIRRKKLEAQWFERHFRERYVFALGDPVVDEVGRADIYADGKLIVGFGFKKNSPKICDY